MDTDQNLESTGIHPADAKIETLSRRRDGDVDDLEEASCKAEVILVWKQNS